MVASPPPPLLSAVPPQQQQQQQRYGLPPAPLSPLLPAPSTPTIMSTAGVPAPERPTPSRASEIRRATKPIMEKRRRARINQCLTELKALILDALNKDPSRHSKLEKADILEMTVRHLQNVQRHQVAAALSTDPVVMNKFRAGFAECATEVSRYVTRLEGVEPSLRQRLVGHLTSCVNGLNGGSVSGPNSPLGGVGPGLLISPLSVQIPTLADLHGPSGHLAGGTGGGGGRLQLGGLPLIPSRLPNGDLAFVLPAVATAPPATGNNNAAAPSNPAAPGPCWGPPTPTNTSTPTSPHPPRSPSPASSFGGSPLCSPGGSDIGSEDASSSDAMLMLQRSPSCFSPQPPSEELAALPRHRPPFFREVLHGLEAATQRREPHEQREEDEDEDQSGGGDDSVWRPW